jgi:hypothetical protein
VDSRQRCNQSFRQFDTAYISSGKHEGSHLRRNQGHSLEFAVPDVLVSRKYDPLFGSRFGQPFNVRTVFCEIVLVPDDGQTFAAEVSRKNVPIDGTIEKERV